ncbi:MAG: hypothetical protein IT289_03330 [Oligoflexia bacterium]|nr:hypothetical protein [Oligoflexia bacterium]
MKRFLITLMAVTFMASASFAQQSIRKKSGPRRQLATIVFSGLGGAILGLSTLSFYGRPQEYLGNIAIGFAVGVIGGTTYVTFRSATTREYYVDPDNPQSLNHSIEEKTFAISPAPMWDKNKNLAWGFTSEFRF